MNAEKFNHKESQLKEAILRVGEIVEHHDPDNERDRDALIQRFEFTIELYWKVLKMKLEDHGETPSTPKEIFIKSYGFQWLKGTESDWLQMLKDRNLSSHTYDQDLAIEIFNRVISNYNILYDTYDHLFGLN